MKLVLRPFVQRDLDEAARWYEEQQPGLRETFLRAVEDTLDRIEANPHLYPAVRPNVRRAALRRFPYGVYYRLVNDEIQVLAVVHDARNPSVWQRRH